MRRILWWLAYHGIIRMPASFGTRAPASTTSKCFLCGDPREAQDIYCKPCERAVERSWQAVNQCPHQERPTVLCLLGIHHYPRHINAHTQAPAPVRCERCRKAHR